MNGDTPHWLSTTRHVDIPAEIRFDGKWTWLPLPTFYDRYCQSVQRADMNVLGLWKTQLRIAAVRARDLDQDDANEDDDVPAFDKADFEAGD